MREDVIRVAEMFPHVPPAIIADDLNRTLSVPRTIENILERRIAALAVRDDVMHALSAVSHPFSGLACRR